jgi:hypothetical protein
MQQDKWSLVSECLSDSNRYTFQEKTWHTQHMCAREEVMYGNLSQSLHEAQISLLHPG